MSVSTDVQQIVPESQNYDDINLTEKAREHLTKLLTERNIPDLGLRVFVSGGGCSGMQYGMAMESEPREFDTIVDSNGVKVFNDRGSYKGVAKITSDVSSGIGVSTLGYWRQLNDGTVNSISSANLADMGNAPTFSDNLVEVIKL